MTGRFRRHLRHAMLILPAMALPSLAAADPDIGMKPALHLAGDYFTAPLSWNFDEWATFAATLGLIASSHEFDASVRDHFAANRPLVLDGKDRNSTRDMLPAFALFAGTWAYAAALDEPAGYQEAWHMAEAAGLSTISAYGLKFIAGRRRPNEVGSVDRWFSGGDSFPSLHTTAAFAIGTVLAESGNDKWRWVRRGLGYGIAAATAYQRVHDNAHWLSDTVAGTALGVATASFVLRKSDEARWARQLQIVPMQRGVMVTWAAPLE